MNTLRLSISVMLFVVLLAASRVHGQSFSTSQASISLDSPSYSGIALEPAISFGGGQVAPSVRTMNTHPFSRLALGADISPLGPGAEAAVNLGRHFDARVRGSLLQYSTTFTTNGFNVDANLHFASVGAQMDWYPFRNGFRLSPGVLVYNQNRVNADAPVTPGTSFTLNNQTFYAATPNSALGITALSGTGSLGLHSTRPAFMMTSGWGSLIPRSGRHWAIPFEIGAAFIGSPTVKMNLTGWACYDQAQTLCTNVDDLSNPIAVEIQSDLQAQVTKWKNDLDPLKVYPIISTGFVVNFNIR